MFALVTAAFTTIYITQPVLPVLRQEFSAGETLASFTIAAVTLGIAISNLPFGMLADRFTIKPIILTGGLVVAGCGLLSAAASSLTLLIAGWGGVARLGGAVLILPFVLGLLEHRGGKKG